MDHKDTTGMGATFPSWVSVVEHRAADKMPAWGVEGETPDATNTTSVWVDPQGRAVTPEEGAWPARDRVPTFVVTVDSDGMRHKHPIGLRPAEVTEDMLLAGLHVHLTPNWPSLPTLLVELYRAMHAAAPVPLVSDAEIALTRERDEARAFIDKLTDWNCEYGAKNERLSDERDAWCRRYAERGAELDALRAELMAAREDRDAHERQLTVTENRVFELKAELAKFTTQNAVDPEAPDPIANAIRPREVDSRRMGLA